MVDEVLFSSKNEEWGTPQVLFDWLDEQFHFTLDPCASKQNAKCKKYYTVEDNGFSKDWSTDIVFMNPPYGKAIGLWMEKAVREWQKGATVVVLVPARTDTKWWHDNAIHAAEIWFIRGRLKFEGFPNDNSSTFPSVILVYRSDMDGSRQMVKYVDKSLWKRGQLCL